MRERSSTAKPAAFWDSMKALTSAGFRRCLWSLGALPETLVWDRQSGLHAGEGRPTREFVLGQLDFLAGRENVVLLGPTTPRPSPSRQLLLRTN